MNSLLKIIILIEFFDVVICSETSNLTFNQNKYNISIEILKTKWFHPVMFEEYRAESVIIGRNKVALQLTFTSKVEIRTLMVNTK